MARGLEARSNGTEPKGRRRKSTMPGAEQLPLLTMPSPVLDELLKLDVTSMTPLEAINKLYELQKNAREAK